MERSCDTDTRELVRRYARHVATAELHGAGLRPIEAAEQVQRAGLARTIWPDDAGDGTGLGSERDVLNRSDAAERYREIRDVKPRRVPRLTAGRCNMVRFRLSRALPRRKTFRGELFQQPDDAGGRDPQNQKEQQAKRQQPVLRKIGQGFRQQHDQRRTDHRTERRTGAADHHAEQQ